ncbi:MAG: protein kinase [Kofleriaceae bacterium]|nr:protein kinase [Kofleriaceae bacterium]
MEILKSPMGIAAIGVAVALLGFLLLRGRSNGAPAQTKPIEQELPAVGRLIKKGDYAGAANLAAEANKLDAALELYLRAQQPERAAAIAMRMGNVRHAGELFERASKWDRAADCFEKAGLVDRANSLRRDKLGQLRAGVKKDEPTPAASRGRQLEAEFRQAQALSTGSEADRSKLQSLARGTADALLADGELRRAADVLRDAELHDEAIHLYVNVLGEPGLAAPILAQKGNHERAAELYEMAGESERAATTWVQIARQAPRPEIFLDRIERLSREVATTFLDQFTRTLTLDATNAELYYRFASLLAKKGDSQRALGVYQQIKGVVTDYKDLDAQIAVLESGKSLKEDTTADAAKATTGAPKVSGLSEAQIAALADQVAKAAAIQIQRQHELQLSRFSIDPGANIVAGPRATGLESVSVKLDHLFDPMVQRARGGPSLQHLEKFIGGRPCDLQNIEVYFRVGLVHLAQGEWKQALAAFDAVEDASPGYRDAWKRADEIRDWQNALGKKMTMLGAAPTGSKDVGRYQVSGELGRGGMAVVYRGKDGLLGREVALKFLSEALSNNADMNEMFQREARAVAALNHPNIVTIHDVGVLESRAFICMEFVEGKSLETLLLEPPGLTIVESLRAIKQALEGLAYAHGKKIIHRDIKPANIMRTNAGLVKLMDFGLAKSLDGNTQQSMIAGTPAYMPLEQIRGDELDHRVDLFAIGVTLYEMLSGTMPYEGLDRQMIPKPLSELVPAAPDVLEAMIMAAIDNDVRNRPTDAQAMLAPIESVLAAVSRAGSASAGSTSVLKATAPAAAGTTIL